MSLNETPSGERVHISFFGCRNAGKSSLVNAVTNQELSVVSDVRGTTTDPVRKAMELLPIGPVLIIDTPGFDDEGSLGELRIIKTKQILNKTDIAVLVTDAAFPLNDTDNELIALFKEKEIPYIIAHNKSDLLDNIPNASDNEIWTSALKKDNIDDLKEMIGRLSKSDKKENPLVSDLIKPGSFVVLVIPIDKSAPKGRLILPQQQVIRDILDHGSIAVCLQEPELANVLNNPDLKIDLVITDSQIFGSVSKIVPERIHLTSFSILMARYKGLLNTAVKGVKAIESIKDGDCILISEGCTHHRQCEDIGTVKIPKWLKESTGKDIKIETSSGQGFPEDLSKYALIIHCGGCMLNQREVLYRMKCAEDQNIPITNYGTAIAYMKGILERSVAMLEIPGK